MTKLRFSIAVLLAAFLLAGCGSSGGGTAMTPDPEPTEMEPEPSAYETAKAAIAAAETAAAAQKVVDDLDADAVTGTQLQELDQLVAERTMMLADAEAAAVRKELVDAAMCDAATAECVAAHDELIAALKADVAALAEDENATNAQQTAAQKALDDATAKRTDVAMARDDDLDRTETGMLVRTAINAANGLEDERSPEKITAAEDAIAAAKMAIGEDDDSPHNERIAMAETDVAQAKERNAVDKAIMDARTAIDGLAADADAAAVAAVQEKLTAAKMAVDGNNHLTDAEETSHNMTIADLQRGVDVARKGAEDDAEKQRMAEAEEERKANEANAATAAKLFAGIGAQMGGVDFTVDPVSGMAANDRDAGYNASATAILLSIGGETAPEETDIVTLSEDKKTMVAAHRGWEGKRYTYSVTTGANKGDMYEARVYSDVGPATMGARLNASAEAGGLGITFTGDDNDTFEMTAVLNEGSRIASPSFTHSAGNYVPKLPDPNPSNAPAIPIPGSYYGVAGTYTCTPADGSCAVAKTTDGYEFAAVGAWTFQATNPAARVTEAADNMYASYGWWLYTKADGSLTASAFVDDRGDVPAASINGLVAGSATYRGGAAGKYALSSSTGGTNDAGHFTARATLEADFEDDVVTGTIDQFIGADGQSRDWTVELKKSALFDDGTISDDPGEGSDRASTPAVADRVAQGTVWTIGDRDADVDGNWSGALKDTEDTLTDTSGVPKVATGTFYSTYDEGGKMVGAFGANKQ